MFFEIEFMDGVKRIIDSRAVMQYTFYPSENRVRPEGWGCCMEYFVSSLSQGKALVLCDGFQSIHPEMSEVINTVNIRTIKLVNAEDL